MSTTSNIITPLLENLKRVTKAGSGFIALCPAHDDKKPTLSINPGAKGWLMYCHRGCSVTSIMGELGLEVQSLFYDYRPAGGAVFNPSIDQNFNEWIEAATPYRPCWKLHRFDDVAWYAIQREPARFARAGAEWAPMTGYPFEEAMTMWVIMSDGWLHEWLGKWYSTTGMDWKETKQWAHQQMLETWIDQGCSTCPSVESPRPVLG